MLFKQGRAAEAGMGSRPLRPCLIPQFQPDFEGPPPDLAAFEAVLINSTGADPVAAQACGRHGSALCYPMEPRQARKKRRHASSVSSFLVETTELESVTPCV